MRPLIEAEMSEIEEAEKTFRLWLRDGGDGLRWDERAALFLIILQRIRERSAKAEPRCAR